MPHLCSFVFVPYALLSDLQERYQSNTKEKASFLYDTISFCSSCKVCLTVFDKVMDCLSMIDCSLNA